jgi:DNA invertase Pin-like site-specific DNA recombinase
MIQAKCYSYIRLSSKRQLRGDRLQRQLQDSQKYALEYGLELVDESFRDLGVSALRDANVLEGSLGRFIDAVKAGKVAPGSILLVESLDRLSRQQVRKGLSLFLTIIELGVTIITLKDGQIYSPDRCEMSELLISVMILSRAREEAETKGKRVADAWAAKRRSARNGKPMTAECPAWLRLDKKRNKYEVIEERAEAIRLIFEESVSGIGNYSITRRLNEKRIPHIGNAKGWRSSYVAKILKNRAVLGEFQPHRWVDGSRRVPDGDPVQNYYPQIIDEASFYRVQQGLAQRRGKGGRKGGDVLRNLFSGLAYCAYCHGKMKFENKGDGPKGGFYLACDTARRGLGCEKGTRWRYDEFEQSFLAFVREVDLAPLVNDDSNKRAVLNHEIAALKGELVERDAQRDRTFELLQRTTSSADYVARKLDEIEKGRAELKVTLEKRERELLGLDGVRTVVEDIKPLIEALQRRDGEAYKLRSRVASRLRSIVYIILVAPLGQAPLIRQTTEFQRARGALDLNWWVELEERTLSEEESRERYFMVEFNDQTSRAVTPSADDPLRVTWEVWHDDPLKIIPDEAYETQFPGIW